LNEHAYQLRRHCGHDSFTVEGCANCAGADAIEEVVRLRAALAAAPQPDPVAWISEYGKDGYAGAARRVFLEDPSTMYPNSRITPLYTSPPAQPEPLTDARIDEAIKQALGKIGALKGIYDYNDLHVIARAVERAIREKP
jgi:hypothetical protein